MRGFARFRKKKEKIVLEPLKQVSQLENFLGNDKETYEALFNIMLLDPRKTGVSMKEAGENAKKFEKAKDLVKTKTWYEIAGGMAIYEGDVKKVVEFFSEVERLSPGTRYAILRNPQKAVARAQEYYREVLSEDTK